MKRPIGILSLLLIASLVFALACGDGDDGEEEALSPAAVEAGAGTTGAAGAVAVVPTVTPPPTEPFPDLMVRDLLRITGGFSPPLGGSFQDIGYAFQLFDGLTALDTKAIARGVTPAPLVPNVAQSWDISPDGKVYTFKIRPGLKFQSGRPVTADAVAKSFERAIKVATGEGRLERFSFLKLMQSFEALDELTLRMTLSDAFAPMLSIMATKPLLIVDADEYLANEQKTDNFPDGDWGAEWGREHSAGSGPFYVEEFVPEERLTLRRNQNYGGGFDGIKPAIERIFITHLLDNSTASEMLRNGDFDVVMGMDPATLEKITRHPDIRVVTYPSMVTCNIVVDRRIEQLQDPRGLEVLKYAIDYVGFRDVVAGGLADIHQSNFLPGMLGHDPALATKYTHDPAKAKQLMAELGYPNGYTIKLQNRRGSCGPVNYDMGLEFFQNNLLEIGINTVMETSTDAKLWGGIADESFRDFAFSGAGATYFDPDNPASVRATSECYMLGWDDVEPQITARVDELLAMGKVEQDTANRDAIYREINELMVAGCGYITILHVKGAIAYESNVRNIVPAPHAFMLEFRYIIKEFGHAEG